MSEVSQELMTDSYFEDPAGDYYDHESGKSYSLRDEQPSQSTEQAQTQQPQQAQQEEQAQQPPQPQPQQPQPQQPQQEQQSQPQPQPQQQAQSDPFAFLKSGDDGSEVFDANTALEFLQPKKAPAQSVLEQPQQAQQQAQQQPQQPAQQEPSEVELVQQNLNRPFEYYKQYRSQGYDADTAVILAQQQVEADVQAFQYDKRFSEMESKFSAREKQLQEERETVRLEPKAEQNIFNTAKSMNMSVEQFNQLMFDRRYGGDRLIQFFNAMNPDKAKLKGQELQGALQSWYTRTMSDPGMAEAMAELAQARVYKSLMPKIIQHARQTAQNVGQQNSRARVAAPNRNSRGRVSAPKTDALDDYLSNNRHIPTV